MQENEMNTTPSSVDDETSNAVETIDRVRVERPTTAYSMGFFAAILLAKEVLTRQSRSFGEAIDALSRTESGVTADLQNLIGAELTAKGIEIGNRMVETRIDAQGPLVVLRDAEEATSAA